MDSRFKTKALVGLGISVPLFLGGWTLIFVFVRGPSASLGSSAALTAMAMFAVSIPFYLWGCAALAKGKGYSTAILLTCVLGWLFPLVILLALPDKNRHRRTWRRHLKE